MGRLLPEQASPLTRGLDPAALVSPIVAVEAVRRTVALAIETVCGSVGAALSGASNDGGAGFGKSGLTVAAAADALRQAQEFISDVSGPPDSKAEELRLTSTLHALDHASQLAKIAREEPEFAKMKGGSVDVRAGQLCAEAMQKAASVVGDIARESGLSDATVPIKSLDTPNATPALAKLEQCAKALCELRRAHRATTLSAVASGEISADQAMDRVETVRHLDALAHHACRSAAHLVGRGEEQV